MRSILLKARPATLSRRIQDDFAHPATLTLPRKRVVKLHPCHFALMVLYRQPNGIRRASRNIAMVSVPPKGSLLAPEKALEGACIYNEARTGFNLPQGG